VVLEMCPVVFHSVSFVAGHMGQAVRFWDRMEHFWERMVLNWAGMGHLVGLVFHGYLGKSIGR
jgi:hypothetical protein